MNSANISTARLPHKPFRILVAEDQPDTGEYLRAALHRPNFVVDFAGSGDELLSALEQGGDAPSLVILDVAMPSEQGITILREIRDQNRTLPVIMLSGDSSGANRVEAIESGASDFLAKPVSSDELRQAVDDLLPSASPAVMRHHVGIPVKPGQNLKASNWIRKMEPLLNGLAGCDVPVLLQGETGVGKEVLARHIHNQSLRSGNIFLKLNCAALPSELVESELFGYERGAFTGAFKSTPGKFELANGGTILLDEIGDMDLRLQAKLLQVLQDREFHRIGARESTQVDVRVIAATHRELETQILQGAFREDLYYRLNVVNIVIPPLRERLDEIIPLASVFLKKHSLGDRPVPEIGATLRTALLRHHWPGNIRELENIMRRYLVLRSPEMIIDELQALSRAAVRDRQSVSNGSNSAHSLRFSDPTAAGAELFDMQPRGRAGQASRILDTHYSLDRSEGDGPELVKLDDARHAAETEAIMKALYVTQWNRKRAASLLGVDYKALLYKMKKLGID